MKIHTLAAAASCAVATSAVAGSERVIDASDRVQTVMVDGEQVAMEIAPDGTGNPVLSPSTAARLGLKGSMVKGIHPVGDKRLEAKSNTVRIDFGDGDRQKRRAFFMDADWTYPGEARISPVSLPEDTITYVLRAPVEGEREITLPLSSHERNGFFVEMRVGEDSVPAYFTLERRETMANAAAGLGLSQHYGGRMEGDPREIHIEFGVERPVRPIAFERTPVLGELALTEVVVRTRDTGSTAAIPDEDADPNEIVVTGGKAASKPILWVGTAALEKCSRLVFDREAELVRLSCRFD